MAKRARITEEVEVCVYVCAVCLGRYRKVLLRYSAEAATFGLLGTCLRAIRLPVDKIVKIGLTGPVEG